MREDVWEHSSEGLGFEGGVGGRCALGCSSPALPWAALRPWLRPYVVGHPLLLPSSSPFSPLLFGRSAVPIFGPPWLLLASWPPTLAALRLS